METVVIGNRVSYRTGARTFVEVTDETVKEAIIAKTRGVGFDEEKRRIYQAFEDRVSANGRSGKISVARASIKNRSEITPAR